MILPDVNVLVYAYRREADDHDRYRTWLTAVVAGKDELALHDLPLLGFARIVTNPRIMARPAPLSAALAFVDRLRGAPRARWLPTGDVPWDALRGLATNDKALGGNLLPDAHLAALAIAHGARLATADRGFARFPELDWFDPAA
ncbi:MAG: PIN domain-containing protein [Nitriliruptorales bacterium]|nr:PIN domain-containing protein [Nitriliruptorales bacterium]